MIRKLLFIVCITGIVMVTACQKDTEDDSTTEKTTTVESFESSSDYDWDSTSVTLINLEGTSISIAGSGATVSELKVIISSSGNYKISGTLTDGQIVVSTSDEDFVRIILNNASINCSSSSPIFVEEAKKVMVILADNTNNTLTDGKSYIFASADTDEPNATLFSKADLTIYGNGSLTINSNYNDGISSKDGLIIKSGNINVTSVDDGIRGKDFLIIHDGNIEINATGDALKSDNPDNTSAGYIVIENGKYTLNSGGDAISALTNITISNGEFNITSGGGSSKSIAETLSAKGIKGLVSVTINNGNININAADDGVHSNSNIVFNGGTYSIASADDGIHAETSITLTNSNVSISKSVEGIESGTITVNSGNVSIVASDDGFNASKGSGGEANDGSYLYLKGGNIYVNASGGDGLDSNGNIEISGGSIIVHGPQSQPEVGMDYNGTCNITGGYLVISGTNSNMTQGPSTISTQYSLKFINTTSLAANSIFHIQDANGNDILTFKPLRSYYSIVVSSPKFENGSSYSIFTGGSSTGTENNGIITDGVYTAGTLNSSFTISSMVTSIGTASSGGGGGGGPGRP